MRRNGDSLLRGRLHVHLPSRDSREAVAPFHTVLRAPVGVAIMVNKRIQTAVLGCNLKNDRMISVHFQGKPFSITVIQDYAPTSNAEEADAEQYYEDLQDLLELTPKKDVLFIIGDWNAKAGS